jgi:hypothetical protein
MAQEEVEDLLMRGYDILGQLPVVLKQGGVATPDNPEGERVVEPCTVWVANPFMIPAGQIAEVLLESESKDELCAMLFDMTLEELRDELEKQRNAQTDPVS